MTESGSPSDPGAPAGDAPAPAGGGAPAASGGWSAPPPPATVPGAAGFVYGDVLYRIIALIIDSIILGIINAILFGVITGITGLNFVGFLASVVVGLAISAAYFTYTWTALRGTIGMKVLGMQIGNSGDGKSLTSEQGVRRWLVLFGPQVLSQAATLSIGGVIGSVLGLAVLAWYIFLLWTTYSSPTKQGWHDHFANSMVVKAARVVA
jgi:large-conductance mechanosensitive channel